MLHNMKLNPIPFELIKNGSKTIELRLNDEKRQQIKINDEICFTNTENSEQMLKVRVVKLHRFNDFIELYNNLPLSKCGYTKETIDNADPSDMELYYSKIEQHQYGVVGIEIEYQ